MYDTIILNPQTARHSEHLVLVHIPQLSHSEHFGRLSPRVTFATLQNDSGA